MPMNDNDNLIDSERLDLPSASDARARRMCLGRHQLIAYLKRTGKLVKKLLEDSRSADGRYAGFGTRVHGRWAGENVQLDPFEAETLEKLIRLEQMVLTDWARAQPFQLLAREQRLWLHAGITPVHSGRYDAAYVTRDVTRMLILDGKTLMHPVEPADTNDQLRELVALARANYQPVQEFTVAILQPHAERAVSIAVYDQLEAELALRLLRWHLEDIKQTDLPRTYGSWCRFCPALEHCPEAKAGIEPVLATQFEDQDGKLALPIGTDGAAFLRRLVLAKALTETLLEAYKAFLAQNPDDVPGWTLKPGKSKRTLKDAYRAFAVLDGTVDLKTFMECSSVSITKLQAAYSEATGTKGKVMREGFNALLGEVIEYKTDSPSLEERSYD